MDTAEKKREKREDEESQVTKSSAMVLILNHFIYQIER